MPAAGLARASIKSDSRSSNRAFDFPHWKNCLNPPVLQGLECSFNCLSGFGDRVRVLDIEY